MSNASHIRSTTISEHTYAHKDCKVLIDFVSGSEPKPMAGNLHHTFLLPEVCTFMTALNTMMQLEPLITELRTVFGTVLPTDLMGIIVTSYNSAGDAIQRRHEYSAGFRFDMMDIYLWENEELHPGTPGSVVGHLAFHVRTHINSRATSGQSTAQATTPTKVVWPIEGYVSSGDLLTIEESP